MDAIIIGTGFLDLSLKILNQQTVSTPYGAALILKTKFGSNIAVLIARHGLNHDIPPHLVNYRANIWALKKLKINNIYALATVGGISENVPPQTLLVPNQIIDYTCGREHTFAQIGKMIHVDFTEPYSKKTRKKIIKTCKKLNIDYLPQATHAVVSGPRLETKAEIQKLRQDGCDIVGMTGMPEASLARELQQSYACLAICVNWAAGVKDEIISLKQIKQNLKASSHNIKQILEKLLA